MNDRGSQRKRRGSCTVPKNLSTCPDPLPSLESMNSNTSITCTQAVEQREMNTSLSPRHFVSNAQYYDHNTPILISLVLELSSSYYNSTSTHCFHANRFFIVHSCTPQHRYRNTRSNIDNDIFLRVPYTRGQCSLQKLLESNSSSSRNGTASRNVIFY